MSRGHVIHQLQSTGAPQRCIDAWLIGHEVTSGPAPAPLPTHTFNALRPLVSYEGHEGCGFLTADGQLWPTPSQKPSPVSYSIGRAAWNAARGRALVEGTTLIGSLHTHPDGPDGPSEKDLAIARRLRRGEIRQVWHPRSGLLTTYDRSGVVGKATVQRPIWFRALAWLAFR
jgi:hypothetical protein